MAADSPSIVGGMDFVFLGNSYTARLEKTIDQDPKANVFKFLIMPTDPDPGEGMSIGDMIKAVNDLIAYFSGSDGGLKKEDIEETLSPVAKTLNNIRVQLRQLFIYHEKVTPIIDGVEDKTKATKKMEYAVCIKITSGVEISEEMSKLFDFKALIFAIWKTDRKKILSRMNVGSIKDLLDPPVQPQIHQETD